MPGRWLPRRRDKVAGLSRVRTAGACLGAALLAAALLTGCGGDSGTDSPTKTSIRQFTIVTLTPRRDTGSKKTAVPTTYIVQPGDTLSLIATRFHVTEDDLQTLNHLPDPDSLYSGQQLMIPVPKN